jgi:hypothetical protein
MCKVRSLHVDLERALPAILAKDEATMNELPRQSWELLAAHDELVKAKLNNAPYIAHVLAAFVNLDEAQSESGWLTERDETAITRQTDWLRAALRDLDAAEAVAPPVSC